MGSVSTLLAVGFFGFKAKNEIGCFLSLRRCLHNQGLVILQAFQPVLNIRSGVFQSGFADPRLSTKKRSAHFGFQFLFGIRIGTEPSRLCNRRPMISAEPRLLVTMRKMFRRSSVSPQASGTRPSSHI